MSNIVPLRAGQMPAIFANRQNLPDMNAAAHAGLVASFAVVGYKGKNWRIKYRGEDDLLKDDRGVPIPSLGVVIVGMSEAVSKIFYDKKYAEGDDTPPDCFSIDGVTPDRAVAKPQHSACATCPQNAWGSRISDAGKKVRACQDSRRIAVVPAGDIDNTTYGGPMLLRVPPMSLNNLSHYATEIGRFGAQAFMVATELRFNYEMAYPQIEFHPLGWLTDAQAVAVAQAMENSLVSRMLGTEPVEAAPPADGALAGGKPSPMFDKANQAQGAADIAAETERLAVQQAAALKAAFEGKQRDDEARMRAEIEARVRAELEAKANVGANHAEAVRVEAAREAAAKVEADLAARQAHAQSQTAQTQPPRKNAGAFSTGATQPQPTPTGLAATDTTKGSAVVVHQAPTDMDAAIDDLLAS